MRCAEADQDNPFPLYSASSGWLLRAGRVKVVRSNRSALRLCASFLVVGSVALSTFALTVASTATNVKIELPRPFVFPSGIVRCRRKGKRPTVPETTCNDNKRDMDTFRYWKEFIKVLRLSNYRAIYDFCNTLLCNFLFLLFIIYCISEIHGYTKEFCHHRKIENLHRQTVYKYK